MLRVDGLTFSLTYTSFPQVSPKSRHSCWPTGGSDDAIFQSPTAGAVVSTTLQAALPQNRDGLIKMTRTFLIQ